MKLIKCYIENFGKLSSYSYDFCKGLNIIVGENGYGKTTLTIFIKAMLYGLDANKGKGEESERKRYTPWQGGRFGGSLTLEAGGKSYRIERSFGARAALDTFALYDESFGRESSDFSQDIGTELFGMDADGFERTVFLSERNLTPKNQNPTISAKLSNLVGVDGDMGNFDEAIEKLEKKEKELCHRRGKGGLIWDIRKDIDALDKEIIEIEKKKDEYKTLESELSALTEEINQIEKRRISLTRQKEIAAHRTEYLKRLEAVSKDEEELSSCVSFFKNGIPTSEEIALFEGKHVEKITLEGMAASEKAQLGERPEDDCEKIDAMLEKIVLYEQATKHKANFYLHFIISAISLAVGIGLGFISPFLYTVCLVSVIFLFLGLRAIKKRKAALTAVDLSDIRRFLADRCAENATAQDMRAALSETKSEANASIAEWNRRSAAILEKQKKIDRLREECEIFLSKFERRSDAPFHNIRAKLSEYNRISEAMTLKKAGLSQFLRERNLDAADMQISENGSLDAELLESNARIRELKAKHFSVDNRLNLISDEMARADELAERRLELLDSEAEAKLRHRVAIKAAEHLSLAKERLRSKYLDKTRRAFDSYISEIGDEDTADFAMDTDFSLKKTENGLTNPDDSYSLGKRELYALVTRLALSDSLFAEDAPFVILDDPFSHFDDKRCLAAMRTLRKLSSKKQIIYLTCSQTRTME